MSGDFEALRQRLVRALAEGGYFRHAWMRDVFVRVPRHVFAPGVVWVWEESAGAWVSVRRVPPAWLEQVRPGGLIVTPWFPNYAGRGLIWLRVREDGSARGWFHGAEAFMPVRGQRVARPDVAAVWEATRDRAERLPTAPDLSDLDAHGRFALGVRLPGVACLAQPGGWFLLAGDGASWAQISGGCAWRHGPRDLLTEADAAATWWRKHGRPSLFDFGITVTKDEQRIWLHTPDNPVRTVPDPG